MLRIVLNIVALVLFAGFMWGLAAFMRRTAARRTGRGCGAGPSPYGPTRTNPAPNMPPTCRSWRGRPAPHRSPWYGCRPAFPEGWDLADLAPDGLDPARLVAEAEPGAACIARDAAVWLEPKPLPSPRLSGAFHQRTEPCPINRPTWNSAPPRSKPWR